MPVTEVADYTGFPEMLDGRVKTMHPKITGGILDGPLALDNAISLESVRMKVSHIPDS